MRIEVEINEIDNGWIVDDSYYGEKTFFAEWIDAAVFAKKIITRYGREMAKGWV